MNSNAGIGNPPKLVLLKEKDQARVGDSKGPHGGGGERSHTVDGKRSFSHLRQWEKRSTNSPNKSVRCLCPAVGANGLSKASRRPKPDWATKKPLWKTKRKGIEPAAYWKRGIPAKILRRVAWRENAKLAGLPAKKGRGNYYERKRHQKRRLNDHWRRGGFAEEREKEMISERPNKNEIS